MSDAADPAKARVAVETDDSGLEAHLASDIDFDAELSKLTAEAAARTETEIVMDALPVRGQPVDDEINLTDLPSRSVNPVEDAAPAADDPAPAPSAFGDHVPAPSEADEVAEVVDEPTAEVPVVAEHVTELAADAGDADAMGDHADSMWIDPSEMVVPAPKAETVSEPEPAPFSTAAAAEPQPAPAADTAIDFSRLPEPPTFTAPVEVAPQPVAKAAPVVPAPLPVAAAPAPAAPAPAAPAPTAPVAAAPAPAVPTPAAPPVPAAPAVDMGMDMGMGMGDLPMRTPRAALAEQSGLGSPAPAAPAAPAAAAPTAAPANDNAVTAAKTSSQFSAFQAGVQRSEDQRS